MDIKGKNIIVTGASSGIGRAAAQLLARQGARVALVARSREALEELSHELAGSVVIAADLSRAGEASRMIAEAQHALGAIDVLVNNAGRGIYGQVEKVDLKTYEDVWHLNVVGVLEAMQAAIPIMRAQGAGAIVNISSMVSKNYFPRLGAYASTKYALNALTLTARTELAGDHIVVGAVHPGLTDTNFGKNAARFGEDTAGMQSRNRPNMPGADSPEHVATRIAYAIESGEGEVYMH
jgi:short-subunit dehydrogenase